MQRQPTILPGSPVGAGAAPIRSVSSNLQPTEAGAVLSGEDSYERVPCGTRHGKPSCSFPGTYPGQVPVAEYTRMT